MRAVPVQTCHPSTLLGSQISGENNVDMSATAVWTQIIRTYKSHSAGYKTNLLCKLPLESGSAHRCNQCGESMEHAELNGGSVEEAGGRITLL